MYVATEPIWPQFTVFQLAMRTPQNQPCLTMEQNKLHGLHAQSWQPLKKHYLDYSHVPMEKAHVKESLCVSLLNSIISVAKINLGNLERTNRSPHHKSLHFHYYYSEPSAHRRVKLKNQNESHSMQVWQLPNLPQDTSPELTLSCNLNKETAFLRLTTSSASKPSLLPNSIVAIYNEVLLHHQAPRREGYPERVLTTVLPHILTSFPKLKVNIWWNNCQAIHPCAS